MQTRSLIRNKKNNIYLCKPQFYYIKVGFKGGGGGGGGQNYIGMFRDGVVTAISYLGKNFQPRYLHGARENNTRHN